MISRKRSTEFHENEVLQNVTYRKFGAHNFMFVYEENKINQ